MEQGRKEDPTWMSRFSAEQIVGIMKEHDSRRS